MFHRERPIRSQAKQAAIRTLEDHEQEWIPTETGHKSGHTGRGEDAEEGAESLETKDGPPGFEPGTVGL
jgi:hypothetical protein